MEQRIKLYKKNLKEKKYLLNENLELIDKGYQGEVFRIKNSGVVVKKINYDRFNKWIPILNRKNVYKDPVIGNEIKSSEKITKYMIKYNIPFYPLFYGFQIILDKKDIKKSEICLYFEEIKNSDALEKKLNQLKNKKIVENIFVRIIISLYILNKKLNIIHHDLHFNNILIQKTKRTNKFDIFNIDDKVLYVPDIGYQIFIIDFGRSLLSKDNNIECYFLKQQRIKYIIRELCKKSEKDIKQIISNNNIKKIKDSNKYFSRDEIYCIDKKHYKFKNYLYLIAVHLIKYNTDLKDIKTILPYHYNQIYKKLEKTVDLCYKDMIKWISKNFPKIFEKPVKLKINKTYNIFEDSKHEIIL